MSSIGAGVFSLGLLSFFVGIILLAAGVRSRGETDTEWKRFSGPVWFILLCNLEKPVTSGPTKKEVASVAASPFGADLCFY
jgi:hypothetical protein